MGAMRIMGGLASFLVTEFTERPEIFSENLVSMAIRILARVFIHF